VVAFVNKLLLHTNPGSIAHKCRPAAGTAVALSNTLKKEAQHDLWRDGRPTL